MKKLTLDYSKWRCGGIDNPNALGEGYTRMMNEQGFMCCLGQISLQLNESLTPDDIKYKAFPSSVDRDIPLLSSDAGDTILTDEAISINDDSDTTPNQKIALLQELFNSKGYKLEVINKP